MREELCCRFLRTSRELEQLVPQWRKLWHDDGNATPFQSPEWLVPWWHQFGADLRSVAMFRRNNLIGLLPLYLYVEPETRERKLLPLGIETSDYLGGVFADECTIDDIETACGVLGSLSDWDSLYVPQLRPGTKVLAALDSYGLSRIETQRCSRFPAVTIAELPQKLRRNCMYYRNRAKRAGNLKFAFAGSSNWMEVFDALVRFHTARWHDRGQPGVFANERMVRWHREALPLLERAGLLRLSSLRLNGEMIAVIYSLIDPPGRRERTEYIYIPGFSTAHGDVRPGTVLTAMAVERAAGEGVHLIDLLRGDEEYKKLWHAEQTATYGFHCTREAFSLRQQDTGEIAA